MTHPCHVLDPEQAGDDVLVSRHGQELHFHGPVLLETGLGPVLHTRLQEEMRGRGQGRGQGQGRGVGSAAMGTILGLSTLTQSSETGRALKKKKKGI